jgi:hypothetical protein
METDASFELYLLNRNVNRPIRVLQRLEPFSIRSKRKMKTYGVRLEVIRAGLNADFTQAPAIRERADETRLRLQRTAWKRKNSSSEMSC